MFKEKQINNFDLNNCVQIPGNNVVQSAYCENNALFIDNGGFKGLNHKWVVYAISAGLNGWYVGVTNDFSERISTHIHKSRNKNDLLQRNVRKTGMFIIRILSVAQSETDAKMAESEWILGWKYCCMHKIGMEKFRLMTPPQKRDALSEYCYNLLPKLDYFED